MTTRPRLQERSVAWLREAVVLLRSVEEIIRRPLSEFRRGQPLFSVEPLAGAGLFCLLFGVSVGHAESWRLFGMNADRFFKHLHYSLTAGSLPTETGLLFVSILIGLVAGTVVLAAWDLLGEAVPGLDRRWFSPLIRGTVTVIAVGAAHLVLLAQDINFNPALYQEPFYNRAEWLRTFHLWAAEDSSIWLRTFGLIAIGTVLLAALARTVRGGIREAKKLDAPHRVGLLVLSGGVLAAGLGVWSVSRFHAPHNRGTNVLLIATDGLRSDMVVPEVAPFVSRLADNSHVFPFCISPGGGTAPSLMSLFTGQSPLTHGVRHSFPPAEDVRIGPESLLFSLRNSGYSCVALADRGGGFLARIRHYFDRVRAPADDLPSILQERALRRHCHLFPYLRAIRASFLFPALWAMPEISGAQPVADKADYQLKQLRFEEKFFLTVFMSSLQEPFILPSRPLRNDYNGAHKYALSYANAEKAGLSEIDKEHLRQLYLANVRSLDSAIADILASLKKWKLNENTIVIIWSPRGEQLFAADTGSKDAVSLEKEDTFFSPLIIHIPRRLVPPRRVSEPVRVQDIAPTILSLLNIPAPESMEGFPLDKREFGVPSDEFFLCYSETEWPRGNSIEETPDPFGQPLGEILEIDVRALSHLRIRTASEDSVLLGKHRMIQLGTERLVYLPSRSGVTFAYYDYSDPEGEPIYSKEDNRISAAEERRGDRRSVATRGGAKPPSKEERVRELKEMFYRFLAREGGWHPQNGFWIPEAFLREQE